MPTPTVTITVAGIPVSPGGKSSKVEGSDDGLFMVYAQMVKGEERKQWLVFPPQSTDHGRTQSNPDVVRILSRHQAHKDNRTKWFHADSYKHTLAETLTEFTGQGWHLDAIVAVPLENDDYNKAWNNDTPHKAMRAVSKQLEAAYGITVK